MVVKGKVAEKRILRKKWQQNRTATNKRKLNKATKELKKLLYTLRNQSVQGYLEELTPMETTDYSLWKATRKLKRPLQTVPPIRDATGKWARTDSEKASAFAEYLSEVFKPFDIETPQAEMEEINSYLKAPFQMDLPVKKFNYNEVRKVILHNINPKKAPGYDLVTGKILQNLTRKGVVAVLQIMNAILAQSYFPHQWKVSEIIMILKPAKNPSELTSYRPISLLPIMSKLFEKLLLMRLEPILQKRKLIPDHQFGFRRYHGTIEQVHRIVNQINNALERKTYCAAAFLDVSQAFDKVWHNGLFYKLKSVLPHHLYEILKSYLTDRLYLVRQRSECTDLFPINSGVPQGSVLGPVLYLLYTADLPTTRTTSVATFADDTAVLSSHFDPQAAARNLQTNLNMIQKWFKKWKIKPNEAKSTCVTFTMKQNTCPPVYLNNHQIPQADSAKYLGLHLDRRLTWRKHIFSKRKQLGLKLHQLYWLIGKNSQLKLENKLLVYKVILKPIWTYGIQLWGSASNSNLEILQRFQNKTLRMIVNAPWYVTNSTIEKDLQVRSIRSEIIKCSESYRDRVTSHPNIFASELLNPDEVRRLKRFKPNDLVMRFN